MRLFSFILSSVFGHFWYSGVTPQRLINVRLTVFDIDGSAFNLYSSVFPRHEVALPEVPEIRVCFVHCKFSRKFSEKCSNDVTSYPVYWRVELAYRYHAIYPAEGSCKERSTF
jgi:hypothetical protein